MLNASIQDLKNELTDMQDRFPKLHDSDLFVAWFLKSFLTENEQEAIAALVGGAKDKSLDAIFIDEQAKKVFVVQGKYHKKISVPSESRSDVIAFTAVAEALSSSTAYATFIEGLDVAMRDKVAAARKSIEKQGFRLQMYYVTTGRCSDALAQEGARIVQRCLAGASLDVIDGKRVLRLMADYLDGVAPPIPLVELEIENGRGITLGGVLQRFDAGTQIESWVFPVNVEHVAEMYAQSGVRLFARNVRGFLGNTAINKGIENTLENEPEYFWYYNNGVTIVCDGAEQTKRSGRAVMKIINPQVINGQQTTRALYEKASTNSKATVMVRVISVPRGDTAQSVLFDKLVSKIVAATNWQNAIRASDLMANDRRQIELERNLRKLDYLYLRKRQTKGEARRIAGVRHRFILTKEELAQTVAACDLDPLLVRQGKEGLFEEQYYGSVFPNSDPIYYLPRYWLTRNVAMVAKGHPEWAYAKWLITHYVWKSLGALLNSRSKKEAFYRSSERRRFEEMHGAIEAAYKGANAFFKATRGVGETAADVSTFFKRKGLPRDFERYLRSEVGSKYRSTFERNWRKFSAAFDAVVSSN